MNDDIDLHELVDSVDILEYISQFADFKESNGEYWALSPLQEERTPSFSVNTEMNRFYDFSSGKGGDVLSFIRYYNRCGYKQAIKILVDYAGGVPSEGCTKKMRATRIAQKFATKKKDGKASKGAVLPEKYMDRYERDLDKLNVWINEGMSVETLDHFNVRYDRFSNRIVYPIRNPSGDIISVSGRTIDPDWKEKGLRKYTYFQSLGSLQTIYGLAENRDSILKKKEIVLFEGAKSVMIAHTWGFENTGALLTSHLNSNQMKLLIALQCRVVFALDKEIDITEDENIRRLKRFLPIEYVCDSENVLDAKMSPVDAGIETWSSLYEKRLRYR